MKIQRVIYCLQCTSCVASTEMSKSSRNYSRLLPMERVQQLLAVLIVLVSIGEATHHPLHCAKWQHHCQKYDKYCTGEASAVHKVWKSCCDPLKYESSGDSSLQGFNETKGLPSDIYTLKMNTYSTATAWCDMTTDGGGWMVILRRSDDRESFDRFYDEYEDGFGDLADDFFYGLRALHDLTSRDTWEMRIDFYNKSNDTDSSAYGVYDSFKIGQKNEECDLYGRCDGYRLHLGKFSSDNLQDNLNVFDSEYFLAKRRNEDSSYLHDCLTNGENRGGWWYVDKTCTGDLGTGSILTDRYNLLSWYDPSILSTNKRLVYPNGRIELKIRQKSCLESESNLTI